ncbi:MAG: response regulator [Actinobacteria bacterium]|nr:response regulator [Actinomycetota bacterium]
MARILVCDDEPGIRSLLGMLLGFDHDVTEVGDGQAALDELRGGQPYDLVVLDVMMPRLDGLSTLKEIRGDPDLSALKVIMLSARSTSDDRAAGIAAGADAYVGKPFEPEDLQTVLDDILGT